ncbi:hypothetical protein BGZ80_003645 [Entomortierella chlamydospora]|uniref:Uncharacterized protein n=1 Tax=Entomortierella chlamydospora TaxID=101097 RepID=A0A9P6MN49_9FUNG|nr:hypothetical protein BGZ80_003645 [Entomortierella chlamydospora]
MASYSDCRALLRPLEGDPHVAAHISMGSKFDVSQKALVASILEEVRVMATTGVDEPRTPHGRRQKLYIAEVRHQEAQFVGVVITGLQALAMIAICITGSFGASRRSVIYLWIYVLAALVTTSAAISCYPIIPETKSERRRTKGYVVTPNWNSDELFMLIGDGDELAAILNRPAIQNRIGRAATIAVSMSCFFVAVESALLLGQSELQANLSMLLLVCVGWFDWCPLRYRRRWCGRSIEHTLDRRRTAYTAIQVLHGRSDAPGWWNGGLPDTPRSHRWAEAVEAACKGILTPPALPVDDFADLKSARDVLEATIKEGFTTVTSDAEVGLKNFMKAS